MREHSDTRDITLPDFRNWGVVLRILILAQGARLLSQYAHAPGTGLAGVLPRGEDALLFEPLLLASVAMLALLSPRLARLPYMQGIWLVIGLVALLCTATHWLLALQIPGLPVASPARSAVVSSALAAAILLYLNWRAHTLAPSLHQSRLAVLQARIRPHFLFNSLNTAISVVRRDSRLAETILLDMSELFRQVLQESRELVPLEKEIAITRAYLGIESIRLGERLRVNWQIDNAPPETPVPVLLLQPLVENAVHHGIEPSETGGCIGIRIGGERDALVMEISNPVPERAGTAPDGNGIAMATIAQRLALHFDEEAQLRTTHVNGTFRVRIKLPLRRFVSRDQHCAYPGT